MDMFFHGFRGATASFFGLELVTRRRDGAEVFSSGRGVLTLEGGGSVLEEQLPPEVEKRGLQLVLVAEVGGTGAMSMMASRMATFSGGV